jgi:hypothetical protein
LYCALVHNTIVFIAGLIKFFGNVAQLWPKEVFAEYPNVVTALFETFDNPDLVLLGVAMETVGYIGTSVEGKYMLDSLGMSYLYSCLHKALLHFGYCAVPDFSSALHVDNLLDTFNQFFSKSLTLTSQVVGSPFLYSRRTRLQSEPRYRLS